MDAWRKVSMIWLCHAEVILFKRDTFCFELGISGWCMLGESHPVSGGGGRTRRAPPLKLEKIRFFGVKSWFFTRNTPKFFAPPSARRKFFMCAPLTWNPGSAPVFEGDINNRNDEEIYDYFSIMFLHIRIIGYFLSLTSTHYPSTCPLITSAWIFCKMITSCLIANSLPLVFLIHAKLLVTSIESINTKTN
jgi:hypothetical protein